MLPERHTYDGIGSNGTVPGDLCVTIPAFRFQPGSEREIAESLIAKAAELSSLLGASKGHNHTVSS
jgi:hypothetical protein